MVTDHGAVQNAAAHSDQAIVSNRASVQHGLMSDGYVGTDDSRGGSRSHMHDAQVLDIGAIADPGIVDVTPDDRSEPDARLIAYVDVADNIAILDQESTLGDLGPNAIVRQDHTILSNDTLHCIRDDGIQKSPIPTRQDRGIN